MKKDVVMQDGLSVELGVDARRFRQKELGEGYTVSTIPSTESGNLLSAMQMSESNNCIKINKYHYNLVDVVGQVIISIFFSDERLKENVKEPVITNVCSYIEKIQFKSFKWKERHYRENDGLCELGVIAQQLESVHPDLVITADDKDTFGDGVGTKSVNTNAFSTFMMKGIQEEDELEEEWSEKRNVPQDYLKDPNGLKLVFDLAKQKRTNKVTIRKEIKNLYS
jgi:hypothetical protein